MPQIINNPKLVIVVRRKPNCIRYASEREFVKNLLYSAKCRIFATDFLPILYE